MKLLVFLGCVGLLAGALMGCGQDTEFMARQSCVIGTTDADAVLAAATTVLRREFGRVHVNPADRSVATEPAEFSTTRESGTARDLYRGRSTMRRIAHFDVARTVDATVARLRIDIERQDTARAQAAQPPTGRLGDTPAYTPIERDAATSARQNAVWLPVRRDRRLERLLLDELQEVFAGGAAAPTTPAAAQPPREGP